VNFVQTIVSAVGFRDPAANADRLGLLANLFRAAADAGADVVALPAGVLSVDRDAGLAGRMDDLAGLADRAGVACLAGVDVCGAGGKGGWDEDEMVRSGRLPFFAFAVGRGVGGDAGRQPWRQTNITSGNAELVAEDRLPGPERIVTVAGRRVGVLICGELYSWRARQALADLGADLYVDLGHTGMGQGLIPAMRNLATAAGRPVAHSQHVKGAGSLHFVAATGEQDSRPADQCPYVESGALWASWFVRTV
jgi:hypothetical protein